MMFLRYESFKEYIRYYPINTIILALVIIVHIGFVIFSAMTGVDVHELKAVYGGFIKNVQYGIIPEFWRYVTSIFLHSDFGHLFFNAFSIFVFAPPLERAIGSFRYLVLFLFSGIIGNVFTNLYGNAVFSLGASGAVYGVFGAYLYYMLFHRNALDEPSRKTLKTLLIVGVIFSVIIPQVNMYAHLGGFVGGFVLNGLYIKFLHGRAT